MSYDWCRMLKGNYCFVANCLCFPEGSNAPFVLGAVDWHDSKFCGSDSPCIEPYHYCEDDGSGGPYYCVHCGKCPGFGPPPFKFIVKDNVVRVVVTTNLGSSEAS